MTDVRWRLVIHGGSGAMRPGQPRSERPKRAARAGLDAGARRWRGHPGRRRQRARRGRSGGPRCSRTIRASTPGAAACSPPTAWSSSTPRSWTAAPRAPARSPACARPAPRSASRGTLMEQGPHVFLSGKGADQFARDHGLEQVDNDWFEIAERRRQLDELLRQRRVRRRGQIWHGRRGRGRRRTAMSPPRPRPAG